MAGPITFDPLLLPEEERSPLISLANGEMTPEMCNSIRQMRVFKGSREEAEDFLGDMIRKLFIHFLSSP